MIFYYSPLEQFEIIPFLNFNLGGIILSITNETFFYIFIVTLLSMILHFSFLGQQIIPIRWQSIVEEIFFFAKNLVLQYIGPKYVHFFPFIFFIFTFILLSNLIGMIPYTFTITSHIMVTFFLGLSLFIGINIIGIKKHGINFLEFFLPAGAPLMAAPIFVFIELMSYFARVFSLSIRLFANLMSGHALLKILAGFCWTMLISSSLILQITAIFPLLIIICVTLLELSIALLQAYVFTILICLYLHDVIALSH